jgi:Kef-type K+ transport system membrane component KefB
MFMFLVGMGINPKELRERGHAVVLTSHVSITVPFALGCLLAVYLYARVSDAGISFTTFALSSEPLSA